MKCSSSKCSRRCRGRPSSRPPDPHRRRRLLRRHRVAARAAIAVRRAAAAGGATRTPPVCAAGAVPAAQAWRVPLGQPPGDFSEAYPSAPSSKYQEYKIKFAQVVDDMMFDVQDLVCQIPRAQLGSPTILSFVRRAPEEHGVMNIDDVVPDVFRVHYREGTFTIRAPKPQARTISEARSRRRRRKAPRPPQPRPPPARPAAAPKRRALQAQSRAVQHRGGHRLVFRSGVLEGTTAPDRAPSPFTLWPQTQPRRPLTPPPGLSPPRAAAASKACQPRPKKRAHQAGAVALVQTHPEQVADLLRSVANLIASRPSAAPEMQQLRILRPRTASIDVIASSG